MINKVKILKEYFSVPLKPVTNSELLQFRREDKEGFDELADLCAKELGIMNEEDGNE